MTDKEKIKSTLISMVAELSSNKDVTDFVLDKIYPRVLELGDLNKHLLVEIMHAVVDMGYTVWIEAPKDFVETHSLNNGYIKINSRSCRSLGLDYSGDDLLLDISINGVGGVYSIPSLALVNSFVEVIDGGKMPLRGFIEPLTEGIINTRNYYKDEIKADDRVAYEDLGGNVVKVDFGKKVH